MADSGHHISKQNESMWQRGPKVSRCNIKSYEFVLVPPNSMTAKGIVFESENLKCTPIDRSRRAKFKYYELGLGCVSIF